MKLHPLSALGVTLFVGVGIGLASAGCTASASVSAGPDITGCNADGTLQCSDGAYGYACDSTTNPEDTDSSLSCSVAVPDSSTGGFDYCCYSGFTGSSSTCAPDDELTAQCPDPDTYGYQCAAGDNPSAYDSSLQCSDPVPDGSSDDFCCGYGEAPPGGGSSGGGSSGGTSSSGGGAGCADDSSLSCDAGAVGVDCTGGATPDAGTYGICSDPSTQSDGSDGYCCVDQTFSDCTQDDTVTASCDYPSFGFSCTAGSPDPSTDDPSLTCSTPVTDANGNDDYCCQ